ncbi:hypothetical protein NN6n1_05780 [Shinella zoogloeoides]
MSDPFVKSKALMVAVTFWAVSSLPAAGASARLETDGLKAPGVATALHLAFQLPTLLEGGVSPAEEDEAVQLETVRLRRLMVDLGYLDADISVAHEDGQVVLKPLPGRLYSVGSIELKGVRRSDFGPDVVSDLAETVRDFVGRAATAEASESLVRRIVERIGRQDFPLVRQRELTWKRGADGVAAATLDLDTGPRLHFGEVVFRGLRRLNETDIRRAVPFRPGDRYERALFEKLRLNLSALKTVSDFSIDLKDDGNGGLGMDIRVHEAPPDLSVLADAGWPALVSGLAALVALAATQLAGQAGVSRRRLRPMVWAATACVLTFAVTVVPRLVAFLS